ncbi:conserved hypothetical protein [Gluconacetobacter diazotrophicus PA1 5]|nr:hypothetical protein [Gluconacetobacter diazotrophicus]ACI52598.1 conserved hypothetical protein [Gluconacetobacter diazotrophicus PA1 5]MBB2156746.1 hypothetical protein [Gluconacetobacter diazotrophicus]TWB03137.1 hypothetical protein FBZ86_12249 [Gluconacetobacter diazotrophicus]
MTTHSSPTRTPRAALLRTVLLPAALAIPWVAPLAARAAPPPAAPSRAAQPHSAYPDGTGDSLIDRLNAAQTAPNYRGPIYYPGQAIPPAQPTDVQALPPTVPQVVPPPPVGERAPLPPMGPPVPPCAATSSC